MRKIDHMIIHVIKLSERRASCSFLLKKHYATLKLKNWFCGQMEKENNLTF